MSALDQAASQRQQLAAALRAAREATGMSGNRFAGQIGIAQSKVSRIESGQQLPSTADIDRWLEATDTVDALGSLHELREAAATEAVTLRRHRARGLDALQVDVAEVEASAGKLHYWHPTLVPGILQTPAYARVIYEAMHGLDAPDLAEAIARRMDRQALLFDESRWFEFVIGEAALRWWPGPAVMMAGQLDRLVTLAALPNVTLGVLTFGEVPVWHTHHFNLFTGRDDGPLVHVERLAGGTNLRDPDDVARYQDAFVRLLDASVTGDQALALLARVAADL